MTPSKKEMEEFFCMFREDQKFYDYFNSYGNVYLTDRVPLTDGGYKPGCFKLRNGNVSIGYPEYCWEMEGLMHIIKDGMMLYHKYSFEEMTTARKEIYEKVVAYLEGKHGKV